MGKIFIFLALAILLLSLASAEIIFSEQPKGPYNLGETISIPVIIKSTTNIYKVLESNLICNGLEINFYKNGIGLSAGAEKKLEMSLILTKNLIGTIEGNCVIKSILGSESITTKEFKISSKINLNVEAPAETAPEGKIIVKGTASKESKKSVNGFIQMDVYKKNSNTNESYLSQTGIINDGVFSSEIITPEDIPAGEYTIKLKGYEKDASEEITNQGEAQTTIKINQVPKNLEIIVENPEIEPGTALKLTTILHDQTGESIDALADVKIQNSKNKLLERKEIALGETLEFFIAANKAPETLTIIAESGSIKSEKKIQIKEKADIRIQIINRTLIVTNTGNVPYCNKTILIKIGNESLNLNSCIDVDEKKIFTLSAPDGEYKIEVVTDEQNLEESVALTGKSIDIREAASSVTNIARHPFVWFFVIGILGFMIVMVYKKGYKKTFIGLIHRKKTQNTAPRIEDVKLTKITKQSLIIGPKAKLSLSIQGQRQKVSVACLKIKNFSEVQRDLEGVKETFTKISQIALQKKAASYENESDQIFIFAPLRTKTFQNEIKSLELAKEIKSVLDQHNKISRQKIEFGLSLNNGEMILKETREGLEFAPISDLIQKSKRMAFISDKEIFLGESIKEKLDTKLKTQKIENTSFYKVIEIKEQKDHEKFIKSFMQRLEKK